MYANKTMISLLNDEKNTYFKSVWHETCSRKICKIDDDDDKCSERLQNSRVCYSL